MLSMTSLKSGHSEIHISTYIIIKALYGYFRQHDKVFSSNVWSFFIDRATTMRGPPLSFT